MPRTTLTTRPEYNLFQPRDHLPIVEHTPPYPVQERRITRLIISNNTHKRLRLVQPLETIPDLLRLRPTKIPYLRPTPLSTQSVNRTTKGQNTHPITRKSTTISTMETIVQEIRVTKAKDRNKAHRMDSIRETPSLDTCRGATVRELH